MKKRKDPMQNRPVPLWAALLPVLFLIASLSLAVIRYHMGPHQPLILSTAVAALLARLYGRSWKVSLEGIQAAITMAVPATLILMMVGVLIGTWVVSGVVPTLVDYGLRVLSPRWFLPAAAASCAVISLATGSSWSTAGTVGVALMGVGAGLGIPPAMTAGAVISGSYFGDKMSPLSDTTNLAPAVAGTDLFSHVRHMVATTGPSLLFALIGYTILGFTVGGSTGETGAAGDLVLELNREFVIHPVLLVPPAAVVVMVLLRVPPLPALFLGALLGALFAAGLQHKGLAAILTAAQQGYSSHTGHRAVDDLLSRGGLSSMMDTVALILCALSFGGVMERTGFLERLTAAIMRFVHGRASLVAATLASCIGVNLTAGDQYMAIVLPGRMYRPMFDRFGLHPKNLSRCLEDAGTLTSSLVPWNSGGAFMATTLGVATLSYLPFAFLNLINPLVSLFYGITGWTMTPAQTRSSASLPEDLGARHADAKGEPHPPSTGSISRDTQ